MRRRGRTAALTAIILVAALVVTGGAIALARRGANDGGVATNAAPVSSPRPSAFGPAKPNTSLVGNSLYGVDLEESAGRCSNDVGAPRGQLKNSAIQPYAKQVVACLVAMLERPVAKAGFTLVAPYVRTYRNQVSTGCGSKTGREADGVYCEGDKTIYLEVGVDDDFGWPALEFVLAHEFGHHLQYTVGIFAALDAQPAPSERDSLRQSRRIELQANCFAGVVLAYADKQLGIGEDEQFQIRGVLDDSGDEALSGPPDHGSTRAQFAWFERGLSRADFGLCDTWSVNERLVR